MSIDKPLMLPIKKIVPENNRVKSFYFNYKLNAKPGQFVMLWLPGYEEKPFGVVVVSKNTFLLSVAKVGRTTARLHELKEEDKVGIRGPYGSSFSLPAKKGKIALVAGGYGMIPLGFLAKQAAAKGYRVDILLGAKTKQELLIYSFLKKQPKIKILISTDDGSSGFKGYVTELFKNYLVKNKPRKVYIVGPEIMEFKTVEICREKKLAHEVSLERYIKCGFGICGQCCVDSLGLRMCVEGPVVKDKILSQIEEFGKYYRDTSGKIIFY